MKNKKKKTIIIGLIIFFAILLTLSFFMFRTTGNLYGSRLDGLKKVLVSNDTAKVIKQEFEKKETVENFAYDRRGRILNFILTVNEDVSKEDAKKLAKDLLTNLTEDQQKYFDIQVFLKKSKDDAFDYIGYKNKSGKEFFWTNN